MSSDDVLAGDDQLGALAKLADHAHMSTDMWCFPAQQALALDEIANVLDKLAVVLKMAVYTRGKSLVGESELIEDFLRPCLLYGFATYDEEQVRTLCGFLATYGGHAKYIVAQRVAATTWVRKKMAAVSGRDAPTLTKAKVAEALVMEYMLRHVPHVVNGVHPPFPATLCVP
jgi:hypothetical protein